MQPKTVTVIAAALMFGNLLGCAWAGDIVGTIQLKSELARRQIGKKKTDASEDSPSYKNEVPKPTENEIENVVVYLEGPNLKATPKSDKSPDITVLQKNKEFIPHVLPIVKGSYVFFENRDSFAHHIYSESQPGAFEIRKHTSGTRKQKFDEPSIVETFCGIHTKMNCYIVVLSNDFFSRVNSQGSYQIKNIPAGTYKLTAWHPRLAKTVVRTVHVEATGSKHEDIEL